jgi:hypothetical protein
MAIRIFTEKEAKKALQNLEDFMAGLSNVGFNLHQTEVKGYFRADSYDWTAFYFYNDKRKSQYVLIKTEHIQHEGYCKKHLNLE